MLLDSFLLFSPAAQSSGRGAAWRPYFARVFYERLEQLRAKAARNVARSYAERRGLLIIGQDPATP